MEIKDKLKQLRKERAARSKTERVRESWDELIKKGNLTTKEKLQQLIDLTRAEKSKRPKKPTTPDFEPEKREPIRFIENPYPLDVRYGKITISAGLEIPSAILSCLSKDNAFDSLDLSTALFIDLETTGLSGGTGVIPFLIGLGYYHDGKFYVSQYFLGEPAEEENMIKEFCTFVKEMDFRSVVTYNGKAFDVPMLETRFILHRQPFFLSELPHLDFLFSARNLWGHKYENCRLFNLALQVLKTGRDEDIPSSEIPYRYFQYIQTGNYEMIEPVLYHNQEDILSLLGVVIAGANILSEDPESCTADSMDIFGAGKILEKVGDTERSVQYFKRALNGKLTSEVSIQAKKRLSYHFKKQEGWEEAVALWRQEVSQETIDAKQLYSFRELAMYLEHKEKNYEEARKIAEEGYVLSMNISDYFKKDFSHRLDRLKRKIKKQQESN